MPERHGIFMLRADVNEVDVQPIDLGDELGVGCSAAPRTAASCNPSPSTAPPLEWRRVARPARDRFPFQATVLLRYACASRRGPLPEHSHEMGECRRRLAFRS